MTFSLGSVKKSTYTSCICIFIRHIQFLWHRNPNFVVQETNDGNHPGLGLDINIINQIDDGDVTEDIDSGLEVILGLA